MRGQLVQSKKKGAGSRRRIDKKIDNPDNDSLQHLKYLVNIALNWTLILESGIGRELSP